VGKLEEFLALTQDSSLPQDVQRPQLEQFLKYLAELGLSKRSQARLLSAVKTFYQYLAAEEMMKDDPTELLQGPKLERSFPEVLAYEEIQQMLASIDLSTDHGLRNRAMLETLYACGLRVSELVGLRLTDLHFDLGFVRVVGKGNKERIVPIGDEAVKHIRFYLEGVRRHLSLIQKAGENIVFLNRRGAPLSRVMVFEIVKACARAAGIEKNVSPHTFRHSFATHLVEGGASLKAVQDMLGHESIITTEIYTHLDTDYLRETLLTFHPRSRLTRPPENK
jgi:integrase/recombinase XerD